MRLLIILFSISILSACGQKGPLFLPDKALQEDEPTTSPAATESSKKEEAKEGSHPS